MAATPETPAFTLDGDEAVPTSELVHSPPPGQVAVDEAPGTTLSVLKSSSRRVADFIKGKADKVAESMQRIRPQRATDQSGSASPLPAPASEGPASPVASKDAALQEAPAPAPATVATPAAGPASPPPGTAVPSGTANVLQLDKLYAAAADLGKKTREGGVWAYHATAEGLRKLTTPARKLQVICRQELLSKPCPQVLLLACSLVATQGVTKPGIFRTEVPAEKLNTLLLHLDAGMLLLPAECDAIVAAALIKHVLANLDEPVLITSMAPRWVQAGNSLEVPVVAEALASLPIANLTVLRLLVETCYRVALKSNVTGMNALALAQQLAPLLLWKVAERPAMKAPTMPSLPAMGAPIQALKARLRGPSQPGAKELAAEGAAKDKDAAVEAPDSSLVAPSTAVAEAGSALPPVSTTSVDYVGLSDASAAEAIGSPGLGSGAGGDEDGASKAAGGGGGTMSAAGGSVLGNNDAASTAAATVAETDRAEPSDLDDADDAAARHSVVEEGEEVPEDGTDEGAPEAAAGEQDAEEEGAVAAPTPGTKVLLTGAELDAVVRLTEHFILSFDELF